MSQFTKPASPAVQGGNALAAGLVRCLAFTEGAGSTLHDCSASAQNLTTRTSFATAAATWGTDSTYGGFITLDGATKDAVGLDTGLPSGSSARTLAILIRVPGLVSPYSNFAFGYGTTGNGLLSVGISSPNGSATENQWATTLSHGQGAFTNLADDAWHVLHYVFDGAGNVTLYTDGTLIVNATAFSPMTTALSGHCYLGQLGGTGGSGSDGTNGANFGGDIAGLFAWDVALDGPTVAAHYAALWASVTPTVTNATGYALAASPGSVAQGVASTVTATLTGGSALSASLVITLVDSLGSVISGPITIANGSTTGSATIDPSAVGTHNVTASHTGGGFTGSDGTTSFLATLALPGPPTATTATPANGTVGLAWNVPTSGGAVASYSIYAGTAPGAESGTASVAGISGQSGTVSGLANGTPYFFTVKAINGSGASVASNELTATPTSAATVSPAAPSILRGATQQFASSGLSGSVTWSSSNTAVATVNASTGLATSVGPGSSTITATNGTTSATTTLTVDAVSITVTPPTASVAPGSTVTLSATVSGAVSTSDTWTTSDPTIATVAGGIVTGVAAGVATITATSVADATKSASSVVTVAAATNALFARSFGLGPGGSGAAYSLISLTTGSVVQGPTTSGIVALGAGTGLYYLSTMLSSTASYSVQMSDSLGNLDSATWVDGVIDGGGSGVTLAQMNAALAPILATLAGLDSASGFFLEGTISSVNGAGSIVVAFDPEIIPPAAALPGLYCSNTGSGSPAKAIITSSTPVDSTHLLLTFAVPFGPLPEVGDTVEVG